MSVTKFKAELYKHQKDAIEKMHNGCILVGGVGSGKSRTSIAYYVTKVLECGVLREGIDNYQCSIDISKIPEGTKLFIITTAKKRDSCDWEGECIPFGLFGVDECNVSVTVDSWNNISKYVDVKDSFFIFDEQRVVGYGAWTKSFLKIVKANKWILLSATPADTWSDLIPVFIANGYYKNKSDFTNRHVVWSRFSKYPKVDRYIETARLSRIRREILVEMNYKRNTESIHQTIISSYDKDLYKMVLKDRWNPYTEEPIRDAGEMCRVLRQIVNTDPDKIRRLSILLSEHDKVIIFYNFNYELNLLRELCEKLMIPYAEWNGHKHQAIPQTNRWVYLCQYVGASEGWNCIDTDTLIFYSQSYSYKQMEQAAGRINRMNTPFKVLYYYHMRTNSSIDRSIEGALHRKKTFNESAFIKW